MDDTSLDTAITVCTVLKVIPQSIYDLPNCVICLIDSNQKYIARLEKNGWIVLGEGNILFVSKMDISDISYSSGHVPTCRVKCLIGEEQYLFIGLDFRKIGHYKDQYEDNLNIKKLRMQKYLMDKDLIDHDIDPHNVVLCGITENSEFEGTVVNGAGFNIEVQSEEFYTGGFFFINKNAPYAYTSFMGFNPIKKLFVLANADKCGEMKEIKDVHDSPVAIKMDISLHSSHSNKSSIDTLNQQLTSYINDENNYEYIVDTWDKVKHLLEKDSEEKSDILYYRGKKMVKNAEDDAIFLKQLKQHHEGTHKSSSSHSLSSKGHTRSHNKLIPKSPRGISPRSGRHPHEPQRRKEFDQEASHNAEIDVAKKATPQKGQFQRPVVRAPKAPSVPATPKQVFDVETANPTQNIGNLIRAQKAQAKKESEMTVVQQENVPKAPSVSATPKQVFNVETANPTQNIGDLIRAQAKKESVRAAVRQAKEKSRKAAEAEEANPRSTKKIILGRKFGSYFGTRFGGSRKRKLKRNKTRKNNLPKKYANLLYRSRRASRIA